MKIHFGFSNHNANKSIRFTLLLFAMFSICLDANSQCDFTITDTVCPLQNLTVSGSSFKDIKVNLSTNMYADGPTIKGNIPGTFGIMQFKAIKENGRYFIFGQMNAFAYINRFEFNSSFDSLISNTYINLFPAVPFYFNSGYDMTKNKSGKWIGMQPAQNDTKLVRYEFDSIDDNSPAESEFSMPDFVGASICKIIGNYVFISNSNAHNIVRVEFDDDFQNILSTVVLTGPFLTPYGLDVVYDCKTNQYSLFSANYHNGTIVRMDFGNSLGNNTPAITVIVSGVYNLEGLDVTRFNNQWMLFTCNGTNLYQYQMDSINQAPQLILDSANTIFSTYWHIEAFVDNCVSHLFLGHAILDIQFKDSTLLNPVNNWFEDSAVVNLNFGSSASGYQYLNITTTDTNNVEHLIYDSVYVTIRPPEANFVTNGTCEGQPVVYTDSSTICYGSIVAWQWTFGDNNSSTLQNPIHTYSTGGNYLVTLTVYAANGDSSFIQKYISVVPIPVAQFTPSAFVSCASYQLHFTDNSTSANDSIVNWLWHFGNSDTSVLQNPDYTYNTNGTYDVQLIVTNSNGCIDSITQGIAVEPTPVSNFTVTGTCIGSSTSFINLTDSAGNTSVNYQWYFGDGDSSTLALPIHNYQGGDSTYAVQLIATAANGCQTTFTDSLIINQPALVSFTQSATSVCKNVPVVFINTSSTLNGSPITKVRWEFSDGYTIENVDTVIHSFAASGFGFATLTVVTPSACDTFVSSSITVLNNPAANFSFTNACLNDSNLFVSTSVPVAGDNIASYNWNFGDSNSSSAAASVVHTYTLPGNYNVVLNVISINGCIDSITKVVNVYQLPVANFITAPVFCSDSAAQFTDASQVINDTIKTWKWTFSNSDSSALQNPSNNYSLPGSYNVQLIVNTNLGCVDTIIKPVEVKLSPSPSFSFDSVCHGDYTHFNFIDLSPSTGLPNVWNWSFGDLGTGNSSLKNPVHQYFLSGVYNVTVTVTDTNKCYKSFSQPVVIHAKPKVGFTLSNPCEQSVALFTDTSHVLLDTINKWNWMIGSTSISNNATANYTFNAPGNYLVQLVATSSAFCSDSLIKQITIYPKPTASFTAAPPYSTPNQSVLFTNTSQNAINYNWNFGDGFSSAQNSPSHVFADTNLYNVSLIAFSDEGCSDTTYQSYSVLIPALDAAVIDVSYQIQNNILSLNAQLRNKGNITINNYELVAYVDGLPPLIEFTTQPITVAVPVINYAFKTKMEVTNSFSPHYFCIEIRKPNGLDDADQINNKKCKSLENSFQLLNIAPNPSIDNLQLFLNVPYDQLLIFEIYNCQSKLIFKKQQNLKKGFSSVTINVDGLSKGLYFLKLNNENTTINSKFEKQ